MAILLSEFANSTIWNHLRKQLLFLAIDQVFFLFIHWIKCFVLDFIFVSVVFCVLFNRSTQKHRNVNVWKNWILLTTQFSLFKEHTCFSARSVWKKTPVLTTKEPCGTNVKINHFECVCVCVSVCMREWASCNRLMHCLCRIIFFLHFVYLWVDGVCGSFWVGVRYRNAILVLFFVRTYGTVCIGAHRTQHTASIAGGVVDDGGGSLTHHVLSLNFNDQLTTAIRCVYTLTLPFHS